MNEYRIVDAPEGPPPSTKGAARRGLTNAIRALPLGKALVVPLNGRKMQNVLNGALAYIRATSPNQRYTTRKFGDEAYVYRLPDVEPQP